MCGQRDDVCAGSASSFLALSQGTTLDGVGRTQLIDRQPSIPMLRQLLENYILA